MTKRRIIKILMSYGLSRNKAEYIAKAVREHGYSYSQVSIFADHRGVFVEVEL